MVTQATTASTTTTMPPSARDFEAYRLVKVEKKSTRAVSKLLRISQTRVCQVIARVGEYLVEVTEPETDARRGKQLAVAKQVAAEELNYCKQLALHSYRKSCTEVRVVREIEVPGQPVVRQATTRQCFGEARYLATFARLAILSSSLPVCNLPITARRSADEIQADEVEANVEPPSEVDCSAQPSEQASSERNATGEVVENSEAIRLYNEQLQGLNSVAEQISETVHPAESTVPFGPRKLTKLERKRLRRDQRKQRSAVAAS